MLLQMIHVDHQSLDQAKRNVEIFNLGLASRSPSVSLSRCSVALSFQSGTCGPWSDRTEQQAHLSKGPGWMYELIPKAGHLPTQAEMSPIVERKPSPPRTLGLVSNHLATRMVIPFQGGF